MDADGALKLLNRIYRRLAQRRPFLDETERYYKGEHPLRYATEEWRTANADRYRGFSDNWCRPVVDAEAERLDVIGIKTGNTSIDSLWRQWRLNEMESQSSQGFVASLTGSRSFVIVWGDSSGQPLITWEHASQVEIEYDWANRRTRTAAIKTWIDETTEYATLYEPDAVWKFQRQRVEALNDRTSQAFQARQQIAGADGGWVARLGVDATWPIANPLGVVPVVEIPNRPLLAADPISEVVGPMAMQNAINLLWAYLFLAADYASMPARVVLHQGPPKMPILDKTTGEVIGERPIALEELASKRMLYLQGQSTDIKSWDAAKLDVFTDVIEKAVAHIAAQTRTPPHYLMVNQGLSNLSGDAIAAAEAGLVKKAMEFQLHATPAIREVFRLAALVLDDRALADTARTATVKWSNPGIRTEAQMADALLKKRQVGYPFEYLLELDDVGPEDIDRIMQMKADESIDPQLSAAVKGLTGQGASGGA